MTLLAALAEEHGTPLFVYDGDAIEALVRRCQRELDYQPRRLLYSAKANPAIGLAAFLRSLGLGIDVCSPGDLYLAERAGFLREEISYTGFGSSDDELAAAAAEAGDLIVDDPGELERLVALGVRRPIGLRVNPAIAAGFHPHVMAGAASSKFGIPLADLRDTAASAAAHQLPVCGLHAHLGSDVLDPAPHVALIERLADAAERIATVRWINLGGGYGTPRRPGQPEFPWEVLAHAAHRMLVLSDGRRLELRAEPGGYLALDAGVLVGRVVAIKNLERPTVVTDASTNQLPSILLYDAHHAVGIVGRERERSVRRYDVAGNLMQAGDMLAHDVELVDPTVGDLLSFSHAGAYAASRATSFNQRPRAAEILLHRGRAIPLRRAERVDELFSRDLPFICPRIG